MCLPFWSATSLKLLDDIISSSQHEIALEVKAEMCCINWMAFFSAVRQRVCWEIINGWMQKNFIHHHHHHQQQWQSDRSCKWLFHSVKWYLMGFLDRRQDYVVCWSNRDSVEWRIFSAYFHKINQISSKNLERVKWLCLVFKKQRNLISLVYSWDEGFLNWSSYLVNFLKFLLWDTFIVRKIELKYLMRC